MKILKDVSQIGKDILDKGTVVTLGMFDGLHIGHMALVRETERTASALDAVPGMLTFPLKGKGLLSATDKYSFLEKNSRFEWVMEQPFVSEFSGMSPAEFAEKYLKEQLNCKCVVIGFNNRFGKMAAGDVEDMKRFGVEFGFNVVVVPPVCMNFIGEKGDEGTDGIVVSSTIIKECLETGNVAMATKMLGRCYSIKGEVKRGKMLGVEIGFPTANVYPGDDVFLPKNGVYAARVKFADRREKIAMINVGVNPTVKDHERALEQEKGIVLPQYKVEANLFDFDEDIYGQEIEIVLEKFMREERKFSGVDELKSVLEDDRKQVEKYFNG